MVENCVVYINRYARKGAQNEAEALSIILPESQVVYLSSLEGELAVPENAQNAMVFGGDGTARFVVSGLIQKAPHIPLLVAPGGSFNAFHKSLVKEIKGIKSTQLANGEDPKVIPFLPAEAEGNLFNVVAELGVLAKEFKADRRRISSGKMRTYEHWVQGASAAVRGFRKYPLSERTIRIFSTGPFMGQYEANPYKSILGNNLTYIQLHSDSEMDYLRKAFIFGFCIRFGKKIPYGIVDIQEGTEFEIDDPGITTGNFDGERKNLDAKPIRVKRLVHSLKVAPLLLD
jgi:hypothetical protein